MILAEGAAEVAAEAADGEDGAARIKAAQGFLLDGVIGDSAGNPVGKGVKLTVAALTAAAEAPSAFLDPAVMGAEPALDSAIDDGIEPRFPHSSDSFTISV